ncbi:MAG: hypothetical protein EXR73_04905 [Myxococcales bacterium]|nr:hypothetical protein [Myxococcales bacterium]
MAKDPIDWEEVLRSAAELQNLVPGAVLVDGTAAAPHAGHRRSRDADHVVVDLVQRFAQLLELLEGQAEWTTARLVPPTLILGDFLGVETGLRQLRRALPLETTTVATAGGPIVVPTPAEMLRIKGWLIVSRNATRDYIDFAALAQTLGEAGTRTALASFDRAYQDIYRAEKQRDVSPLLQLARQLAAPLPKDLEGLDVANYKGIVAPWDKWEAIAAQCRVVAVWAAETRPAP